MQKFNTKSILSKFDFYEYESNNSANDNLDVFNPYDNSLITTLPSDSVSSATEKINRMDHYRRDTKRFFNNQQWSPFRKVAFKNFREEK